jgi:hypothetical protein
MCGAFIPVDGVVLSGFEEVVAFPVAGAARGALDDGTYVWQPTRSSGRTLRRTTTSQRRPKVV